MKKSPLSPNELDHLAKVIAEVERKTSGELRLMLVSRSSLTNHVFPLLTFIFCTLGLLELWYSRHYFLIEPRPWITLAIILGSTALAFILSRFNWVQRRMTWPADLDHQVAARAELEFHREGLGATTGKTGILIFISLMEHEAVVLGDKAIAAKLDNKVWSQVVATVLEGARTKKWCPKLEEAIRQCGDLLARHFPIQAGDKNELPNHVIVKE